MKNKTSGVKFRYFKKINKITCSFEQQIGRSLARKSTQ